MQRLSRNIVFVCLALGFTSTSTQTLASQVYGTLGNFDVVNDTGHECHGFEIEIEDVSSADVYRTFSDPYIRYGKPALIDFNDGTRRGVIVRYAAQWDPSTHTFLQATPVAVPGYVPATDSCWTGRLGGNYAGSGCEHFGVSYNGVGGKTTYHWLCGDPATGTLTPEPSITPLPAPVWSVQPPAVAGAPEVVRAEFEIPHEQAAQYGEAYWVKIYKTEGQDAVELNNLLLDDPLMANAGMEIEWELLQAKPGQNMAFNEAELGAGNVAVARRYEFYHYNTQWGSTHTFDDNGVPTPYVDPDNGEVVACVVDGCNAPTADELGGFVGRQMAAANLQALQAPLSVPIPVAFLLIFGTLIGIVGQVLNRRRANNE